MNLARRLPAPLRSRLLWLRNTALDLYYWPRARQEFIDSAAIIRSPAHAIDLIYRYHGAGFYRSMKPNQSQTELNQLADRVADLRPAVVVEIGTRDGGTLYVWTQISDTIQQVISIDLPGGIHGGGYPTARERLYRLFVANRPDCTLDLLRRDSQIEATKALLIAHLEGRPIDFLFIDGDHRYSGVRKDYDLYAPLVRPGGLIAFHDIRPNTRDSSIEVYRLWDEIKAKTPPAQIEELIEQPYRGWYGIGLLRIAG